MLHLKIKKTKIIDQNYNLTLILIEISLTKLHLEFTSVYLYYIVFH